MTLGNEVQIKARGGGDDLRTYASTYNAAAIVNTGGGNDRYNFNSTTFNNPIDVKMGGGSDVLRCQNSTFYADCVFNGGGGTDEFIDIDNTFTIDPIVKNFEPQP